MSVLANSNAIESGGYNIDRSLRFRSSASAYLSRTPASAGNRKTWTWSGWVKIGTVPTSLECLFGATSIANYDVYLNASAGITMDWGSFQIITNQLFRDPSAWYHFVFSIDTTQATASNRVKMYVNGVQITSFSTAMYPDQNNQGGINNSEPQTIGSATGIRFFDGYLAEVNFIDGQALTPSSFGQTDAVTGVWTPKKYTGTYGTNGFYLDFKTNTSPTTLAQDKSGNGNNWTANNISTTAGATYDSMTDVPTLTSATAANYCTWNPINKHSSVDIREGNLYIYTGTTAEGTLGTIGVSSGKWYWEFYPQASTGGWPKIGIAPVTANPTVTDGIFNTGYAYAANGTKRSPGSDVSYAASYGSGDIIGMALDMDAGTLTFYKNNVSQGTAFTGLSGTFSPAIMVYGGSYINFGQRPFSYTPPTGFKALNTFNLPDPTIKKPNQYMDATTYTGTGSALTVTNSGLMQPDFIWLKRRSTIATHALFDSVRGINAVLNSNLTNAEAIATAGTGITSINSNGFTLGIENSAPGSTNINAETYIGWQWKKGATPGFDIVTYTGDGTSGRNISHSLGVAPKMMIVKVRNDLANWAVYHTVVGNTAALLLNSTSASSVNAAFWNNTSPTSSVFTVGNGSAVNFNALTYVAYLFAEIPGFSKFGSYTGNGSADGPFVFTSFQPKFVMIKRTDAVGNWDMFDEGRNLYNPNNLMLAANASAAEYSGYTDFIDMASNGFKVRQTDSYVNASGGTYIYAAFASNPFKYSLAR